MTPDELDAVDALKEQIRTQRAELEALAARENKRNQRIGTCAYCMTGIYVRDARVIEPGEDGIERTYHALCRVTKRAESAESRVRELEARLENQ